MFKRWLTTHRMLRMLAVAVYYVLQGKKKEERKLYAHAFMSRVCVLLDQDEMQKYYQARVTAEQKLRADAIAIAEHTVAEEIGTRH